MNQQIKGRIFLVGCPRSGTTLLQSMIAAHPKIASFPESHFFEHLNGAWPWGPVLGLASRRAQSQLEKFLKVIDHQNKERLIPQNALFSQPYASAFIQVLDQVTEEQDKSLWLEKTPQHLHQIETIEKFVKDAKFIHLIRNGADVVSSLYEASRKHSEKTWGGPWSIDQCIQTWVKDVEVSLWYKDKSNHTLVRYEHLVDAPESILIKLSEFMGVEFDQKMLQDYGEAAKQVVREHEWAWKAAASEPIRNANGEKFAKLFDAQEREYILQKVAQVKLDHLSDKYTTV
ncbi:sulfotransferase family protein [Laspinema olomoucense]|uniref:Sulfotransferase n=1 Tax=Laspinema olomoucense D3b TaxID=2953688 RepID=A0ABT2N6S9_9CYAN|nr:MULTISPECIES: sulfotransferase [unclassified Laspinema]MCT7972264.1 sulfotransferase [Laspinema sp. D3d]MCT7978400.1 sulfotransferase [Laspinema sp. D3b]